MLPETGGDEMRKEVISFLLHNAKTSFNCRVYDTSHIFDVGRKLVSIWAHNSF